MKTLDFSLILTAVCSTAVARQIEGSAYLGFGLTDIGELLLYYGPSPALNMASEIH